MSLGLIFRVGYSLCTTAGVGTKRRYGCLNSRVLVFADALTAPGGELRVWATPWHQERVLPALRELLEFPFEHVIVSHGEPVHTRSAYERALGLAPWSG